jgi:SAM-dependent methyltransferase
VRLISPRFVKRRGNALALTEEQVACVREVRDRIAADRYRMVHEPCPCGEEHATIISRTDRYGLPLDTVLCAACGTLRIDPYLASESLTDFYVNFYQRMYARVTEPDRYFARQVSYGERVLSFARNLVPNQGFVAEIGCGAGGALSVFQKAGFRVLGCDYSNELVEIGKRRGVPNLYFGGVETLAKQLRPGDSVDLVFLHHVFEHIADPIDLLGRVKPMLAPGGVILLAVPDVMRIDQFPFPSGNLRLFLHIAHKFNYTISGLSALARRVGMEASMAGVEQSVEAPELWVTITRASGASGNPNPNGSDSSVLFARLRQIEQQFVRRALAKRIMAPLARLAALKFGRGTVPR